MAQTTFTGPVVSQNGFADNSFTNAERDAIVNPQPGLLIYNTDENTYQVYTGSTWESAFSGGGGGSGWPFYANLQGQASSIISGTPFYGPAVFTPDGTSFVTYGDEGAAGFKLIKVNVLVPYEVTTFSYFTYMPNSGTYSVDGSNIIGGYFNGNGSMFFSVFSFGGGSVQVLPCTLSTPYDVTSGVFGSPFFVDVAFTSFTCTGLSFSSDGTKAVFLLSDTVSGQDTAVVTQTLPVAYDLSSWNIYTGVITNLNSYLYNLVQYQNNAFSRGISFDATGTTAFITTYASGMMTSDTFLSEFKLGTAYDFGTINNFYKQDLNVPGSTQFRLNNSNYNGKLYLVYEKSPNSLSVIQYGLAPLSQPSITSVYPTSGGAGTILEINGSGFLGTTSVTFNSTTVNIFSVNPEGTTIVVNLPLVSGLVDITVTNPAGADTKVDAFTSTAPAGTTYTNGVDGSFSGDAISNGVFGVSNPSTSLFNQLAGNALAGKTVTFVSSTGVPFTTTIDSSGNMGPSFVYCYFNGFGGPTSSAASITIY